jgi:DNA-binding response OmpR family regulator
MPMETIRDRKIILCIGSDFVNLNLRCCLLQELGWHVLSSGKGYDGVMRFGQETIDAVVLDLDTDGSESALITAELKRQRAEVPVVMVITDGRVLAPGATAEADAVVLKSQETKLLHETLKALLKAA